MRAKWLSRRRVILVLLGVAGLVFLWRLFQPAVLEVETAVIDYGPMQVGINEDGRTRTLDRYVITAPVAGRLRRLPFKEGQRLARNDAIAEIEPVPLAATARGQLDAALAAAQARERAAEAALTVARSAHDQAVRELQRRRKLHDAGAIAPEQLEQYELALQGRAEELASAQENAVASAADVRAARSALLAQTPDAPNARIVVRAPANGTVLRIPERSERIVAPGEPLLELGDADALEAVVDVLSADAVRIRPGMPATISGWGGEPLKAVVRRVEPAAFTRISALGVEEQRVNVILDFEHCPDALGDGYWLDASIQVWSAARALVAPGSAFFRRGDDWVVFRIERGRAVLQVVQIGERDAARVQVLGGLQPGTEVVLFPGDQLTDGLRVKPQRSR